MLDTIIAVWIALVVAVVVLFAAQYIVATWNEWRAKRNATVCVETAGQEQGRTMPDVRVPEAWQDERTYATPRDWANAVKRYERGLRMTPFTEPELRIMYSNIPYDEKVEGQVELLHEIRGELHRRTSH